MRFQRAAAKRVSGARAVGRSSARAAQTRRPSSHDTGSAGDIECLHTLADLGLPNHELGPGPETLGHEKGFIGGGA